MRNSHFKSGKFRYRFDLLIRLGIDLKATARRCATKFACGSSVSEDPATGSSVVIIQGSVVQEAGEFMLHLYPDTLKASNISYK